MIRGSSPAVAIAFGALVSLGAAERVAAAETAFPAAVCGCGELNLGGTAGSDSYDSRLGPYDPSAALPGGDLFANGDIQLAGTVDGDVVAGGDVHGSGTVTGDIVAGGTVDTANIAVLGSVTQNAAPVPAPCPCEDGIDLDALAAEAATTNDNAAMGSCAPYLSGTSLVLSGAALCELPPGRYYLTQLRLSGSAAIVVPTAASAADPVELVLDGAGPFDIGGTGIVNASERAQALVIHSASDVELSLAGTASLAGLVDAPRASTTFASTWLYGALSVAALSTGGTTWVHYDEASLDRDDYGAPGCRGTAGGLGLAPLALVLAGRRRRER